MYEFDSVLSMAERVCFASRNGQREKTKTGMKEVVNGSEDFVLD